MVWLHSLCKDNSSFASLVLCRINVCSHCGCVCLMRPDTGAVRGNTREGNTEMFSFVVPLVPDVLQIICCVLKNFQVNYWSRSVAMKATFKNTHKGGGEAPRGGGGGGGGGGGWGGGGGGGGEPNLTLLLIYLILSAQRCERNMGWNCSSQFSATQFIYLFIPLPPPPSLLPSLPLNISKTRIDSKKTQLTDLCRVQRSTENALMF